MHSNNEPTPSQKPTGASQVADDPQFSFADAVNFMPGAFCLVRVYFDESNAPEDYLVLEVNKAFGHIAGIPEEKLRKLRGSEIQTLPFENWRTIFGRVASGGGSETVQQPIGGGAILEAKVYSPRPGYACALLLDVTARQDAYTSNLRLVERLNMAIEAAGLAVWEWLLDSDRLILSPELTHLLGYCVGDLSTNPDEMLNRVHVDDAKPAKEAFDRAREGGPPIDVEFRMRRRDGNYRWFVCRGRLVKSASGGPSLLGCVIDVTDRVLRETMLKANETRLRYLLTATPAVIYTRRPIQPYRFRFVSDNSVNLCGWSPEIFQDELTFWQAHVHPDDLPRVLGWLSSLQPEETVSFDYRFRASNGEMMWVRDVCRLAVDTLTGASEIVGHWENVSEAKQSETMLRTLSAAMRSASSSIVVTDRDGIIEWVNPAFSASTGFALDEAIGRPANIVKSNKHEPSVYAEIWKTISAGRSWLGELINRRKDGSLFTEEVTIGPVFDDSGLITHYIAIKHDVSERRMLEKQLRQAQRMEGIGMLASGIAHDLNNVLSPIILGANMLRDVAGADESAIYLLDILESSAQRGAQIVKQVLTFARGADGEKGAVSPRILIREIHQMVRATFPKTIDITSDCDPKCPEIYGDATLLLQVLLNLVVNARDAMPNGGRLRIAAHRDPESKEEPRVVLTVSDTGSGIPPDIKEKIFDPFFTTKDRDKGTGLGLSTVHGIVKSHGGTITLDSAVGVGTTFSVNLPAAKSAQHKEGDHRPQVEVRGHGYCVLIVEDERNVSAVTRRILESRGFSVLAAFDGRQAVETFRANRHGIDVVLLDMIMPQLGGRDVLAEIRRLDDLIPIIVTSGLIDEREVREGRTVEQELHAHGVFRFLRKPYAEGTILLAIKDSLALRQTRNG